MKDLIVSAVLILIPMILSLTVHEWAHAFAATRLGDTTAKDMGRLTLSPEKHLDILGSIIFPLIGVFTGFLFGWAKPVPFNPAHFRRGITMKRGTLIVALAGPLSNLVLAVLCGVALKLMALFGGDALLQSDWGEPLARLVGAGLHLNVVLAVFNLAPVPPLDGSKILYGLLPARLDYIIDWLEQHRWIVFIAFLIVGASLLARFVMYPLLAALVTLLGLGEYVRYLTFQAAI